MRLLASNLLSKEALLYYSDPGSGTLTINGALCYDMLKIK